MTTKQPKEAPATADPKPRVKRSNPKPRPSDNGWSEVEIQKQSSKFLRGTIAAARKEYGDVNIAGAGEAGRIVIGLPLPGLAVEYLLQNDVFPLGRMTQIVGTEGTCKSALCFEIARWFSQNAGIAYLFENESKYSPDYALSILGYPADPDAEVLAHIPCNSVNDWQDKLQKIVTWCKDKMADKDVGRKFPVLLILDSLMGKLSIESQDRIEKAGWADRAHPHEALMINNFLKKFPQDLEEHPMCFVCTNHLKPKKSETGQHMERHKAGGAAPSFQETFEIEMKRDQNANIRLVDENNFEVGGLKLVLACKKNSLGETDRKIKAEVRWVHREDPATGEYKQFTRWDWAAATVNLLASFEKGHRADKIKEIVDVQGSGNKWYSRTLGVPSTDPIPAHDLGTLIEQHAEIKSALRKLFGIKERKKFKVGVDYLEQLEQLRQAVEKNMTKEE